VVKVSYAGKKITFNQYMESALFDFQINKLILTSLPGGFPLMLPGDHEPIDA
jgi:hypothetical protein